MPDPSARTRDDITKVSLADGRTVLLVGTAHVSARSRDLVREVIEEHRPDCVCVELDERRYAALTKKQQWDALNLREVIAKKQLATLLANLILAGYQKKLGDQLGIRPGAELVEAARTAERLAIPVVLCDRDIRATMRRAWHAIPWWRKGMLVATLAASLFDRTEIDEEKLAELRQTDMVSELMREMGEAMPELKQVLIDERDTYLAEKIRQAPGAIIVAVVGAGHVAGIVRALQQNEPADLRALEAIPPVSPLWKAAGWLIPATIIGALLFIAWSKGGAVACDNLVYWILANGIPSAIGALLALAHPATIAAAFTAAPITSLTPVIGAGYVTAFVQVMVQPPLMREFEAVLDDMNSVRGWWRNRLLKVFLAFLLPGIGSVIGTWIGGVEIFSNLL